MGSGVPSIAVKTLAVLLAMGGTLFLVPGYAVARCFGVPEPGPIVSVGVGWYLNLTVTASTGLKDWARFGAAQGASDNYDNGVDLLESNYSRPLLLFFQLNVSGTVEGRTPPIQFVNTSVNDVNDTSTAWPLEIVYNELGSGTQDFRLSWNASEVAAVPPSWSLRIAAPEAGPVDMRSQSFVAFRVVPGDYISFIYGENAPVAPAGLPQEVLLVAGATYALLVGLVLILRAHRRKRHAPREYPK